MAEASYPSDLKYHAEHDWARIDGDIATLGHHLVRAGAARRGRVLRPAGGRHARSRRTSPTPRSSPSRRSPTSSRRCRGEIVEVNEALGDTPEQINDDPYGEGWMVKIRLSNVERGGTSSWTRPPTRAP